MRYVTMRRPRNSTQHDLMESPMLEGKTVMEPEPIDTGLVDVNESGIYRVMSPIGFVELRERS